MESPKRSQLDQLDTKMSVVSSEHRARQAVAAAAQAAQDAVYKLPGKS